MTDEGAPPETDAVETESCGCEGNPRRLCDVCRTDVHVFMACSSRCISRHVTAAHGGGVPVATETRLRDFQKALNRHSPQVWNLYAAHRETLMSHVPVAPAHGAICVFGAGSCSDIDLERLAAVFDEVHLVDLDGSALERARDQQSARVRERVVLHGEVDLSGFLERIDDWGDAFPDDAALGQAAVTAAHRLVQGLGRPFDVTVSSCVLSQLMQPFQTTWVLSEEQWSHLDAAVTAVHLATLAGATRAGGSGFMAFDVLSSAEIPEVAALQGRSRADVQSFIDREVDAGDLVMQPDPGNLVQQLTSPGLGSLFASPRLTLPWLWDIGDAVQVVYGLEFQRR